MTFKNLVIAIDFDGTCVTHEYPYVGQDIGAAVVLKYLQKNNILVLNTMRSNINYLNDALDWFKENGITLHTDNVMTNQSMWTSSNKMHADLYIDDAGYNAPLTEMNGHTFFNWKNVAYQIFVDPLNNMSQKEYMEMMNQIQKEIDDVR